MRDKENGMLLINDHQDSIPFTYNVARTRKAVIKQDSYHYSKIDWYEYQINYRDEKVNNYKILSEFTSLPSDRRKTLFIYKSHTAN